MLGFGLFATDQSHKETLSLCASDLVKCWFATLLVHCVVDLEQVYIGGKPLVLTPVPASSPTSTVGEVREPQASSCCVCQSELTLAPPGCSWLLFANLPAPDISLCISVTLFILHCIPCLMSSIFCSILPICCLSLEGCASC